jgi:autotransporter-associated beta strand protein
MLSGDSTSLQGAITNNAGMTFNQITNGSYAGIMSGNGSLTKSGSGTLVLSGSNTYNGGTIVSAGTLQLSNAQALGDSNSYVNVTGGSLNLGGCTNSLGSVTLTSGSITNGAMTVAGGVTVSGSDTSTISVILAGRGGLTKTNAGTLNLFTELPAGSVVVSGGVMKSSNSIVGATTNTNSFGGVVVSSNAVWSNSGTLTVGGSGNGTLTVNSNAQVIASNLLIAANTNSRGLVYLGSTNANTLSLGTGSISFGAGTGVLIVNQDGQITISNNISGKGTITNSGSGKTILDGDNLGFSGTTYISKGTVVLGANANLGGTINVANKTAVLALNTNSTITGTNLTAVAGKLIDNSGKQFTNSIRGSVVISSTGVLQKTYTNNSSVADFGAGVGGGKSFKILSGTTTDTVTFTNAIGNVTTNALLQAKLVNGVFNFSGTSTNPIVMSVTDAAYSSIKHTIQWYNTNTSTWQNTIYGNTGNVFKTGYQGFDGSFNTFLLNTQVFGAGVDLATLNSYSPDTIRYDLAQIMGAYGYDSTSKTAWAVINHNSIFSSEASTQDMTGFSTSEPAPSLDLSAFYVSPQNLQDVPEPSTWALFIGGGLVLASLKARKRSR